MPRIYTNIIGIPYVPGAAVGRVSRDPERAGPTRILILNQSEISSLRGTPAAIIVVEAAPFSHTLIGLLGLGVPTVLVSSQQAARVPDEVFLCLDGYNGRITDDPDYAPSNRTHASSYGPGQVLSQRDGTTVRLLASVRTPAAARQAARSGAQAIGLVRSEFLTPVPGTVPDRSFYTQTFREVCEAAAPLPVTFRLLDVAADKRPAWMPTLTGVGQPLGLQGVRLYNLAPVADVIDAQLGALARLADSCSVRVLLPFLIRVEEFVYWRDYCRRQLPSHVPIGAMAETPASVLDMSNLLRHADFVAIGCNDLMQNLFAADRDEPALRHYLDPYAPLLFRLLREVARQGCDQLAQIQLCGVLSQTQGVLPILLGLGFRCFSVDAPFIPHLASLVVNMTNSACMQLAHEVCSAASTQDVLQILQLPDRHAPFSHAARPTTVFEPL